MFCLVCVFENGWANYRNAGDLRRQCAHYTFTQFIPHFLGHISLRADVYKPYRNIVNHITPYSTWVMRVAEERSANIDVSGVTSMTMRLDGSAVDIHTFQEDADGDIVGVQAEAEIVEPAAEVAETS